MDAKSNTDIQPKREQVEQRIRPFGIIDLIVVTTAMAVLFKLQSITMGGTESPAPNWVMMPLLFFSTAVMALSLSAGYWFSIHYRQTGKLFRHPGHWMLGSSLIVWTGWLINEICYLTVKQLEPSLSESIQAVTMFGVAVTYLLGTILLVISTFSPRGRWSVPKAGLAVYLLVNCLQYAMLATAMCGWNWLFEASNVIDSVGKILGLILAFCIAALIAVDFTKKVKRDWLHWIGIVEILIYLTVLPLFHFFLLRYLNSHLNS